MLQLGKVPSAQGAEVPPVEPQGSIKTLNPKALGGCISN